MQLNFITGPDMRMLGKVVLFAFAATTAGAQADWTQGASADSYQLLVSAPAGYDEYSPSIDVAFENPVPVARDGRLFVVLEWTANGEPQSPDLKSRGARCRFKGHLWCTALTHWFGPPEAFERKELLWGTHFPQGFSVVKLDYDTRYCFRLQIVALGVFAGKSTVGWSRWTCDRTRPAPVFEPVPLPTAPLQPTVTVLPATDGIHVPEGPMPVRVFIEWGLPGGATHINDYHVEKARLFAGSTGTPRWEHVAVVPLTRASIYDKRKVSDEQKEQVEVPREFTDYFQAGQEPTDELRYLYRVCSTNRTGQRCSPGRATTPFAPGPLALKGSRREYPSNPEGSVTDGSAPESTDRAAKRPPETKLNLPQAVKPQARVRTGSTPTSPSKPICELAAQARARNSPATPGLDRQCVDGLANRGGAIAEVDSAVAAARRAEADGSYRLGFDIATGMFGDPALNAWVNTATGPVRIRAGLNAAGRRGFDAAVKFHEARR